MRLGIMGGTFDPIHYGHLFVAEEARVRFHLDQIVFVPNGIPPHKTDLSQVTPARHRYAMTLIATYSNASFSCSPIEIQRPGPSYMVDTLTLLREQNPDAELFCITGVDAVADILSWNQHEKVVQLATFIAATRPGFDLRTLKDRLPHAYLERILLLGSTALGISSSEIRDRIRQKLPVRYLTSDAVLDYIAKHNLYALPGIANNAETLKETKE